MAKSASPNLGSVRLTKDEVIDKMAAGVYVDDPAQFTPDSTGYVLDEWQRRAIRKLFLPGGKAKLAVAACHGSGKCSAADDVIILPGNRAYFFGDLIGKSFPIYSLDKELRPIVCIGLAVDNGKKRIWRVQTDSSSINRSLMNGRFIDRTSNHPLMSREGWKEVKDLHLGDEVLVTTGGAFKSLETYGGLSWEKIVSIENLGIQPTVAIEVPETSTYLSTFYEHNTQLSAFIVHHFLWNFIPSKCAITGPCVEENEKILLADGRWVPVRELSGRYFGVLSPRKDLSFSYQLANAFPNGIKPVFEIKTRSGRKAIRTPNHPFLTLDGWQMLQDIKPGDYIGVPTELPAYGKRKIPVHEVKLLAYMIAEGCTTDLKYGQATFSQTNDTEIQKDFYDCIEQLGGCRAYYRGERSHVIVGTETTEGGRGINPFKEFCRVYGMDGRHSWEKQIPPQVFELNNDLLKIFISRLFAGDGYVRANGGVQEIGYSSTSRELIDDVNRLLLRFGIAGRIGLRRKENIINGLGKRDLYNWYIVGKEAERFALEIGVFGKQKSIDVLLANPKNQKSRPSLFDSFPNKIFQETMELIEGLGSKFRRNVGLYRPHGEVPLISRRVLKNILSEVDSLRLSQIANAKIAWDKVVQITYLGERMTYGIEVPGPEAYVTDFIEHNTGKQTKSQVWSYISEIWHRSIFKDEMDWHKMKMSVKARPEQWFATWLTSKEPKSIEGFHGPKDGENLLWVVEEGKGVADAVYEALQGALSHDNNFLYTSSTCGRASGFFYDCFHTKRDEWELEQIPYTESSRISPDKVRKWEKTWGRDSSIFKARILAQFPEEDDKIIVPLPWCERAVEYEDDDEDFEDAA